MKTLAFFAILVATVVTHPTVKTWTLHELSKAIELSTAEPYLQPYLRDALNQIALALFTGKDQKSIYAVVPSPTGETTWRRSDLLKVAKDPNTKPEVLPFILQALNMFQVANATGNATDSIEVFIPSLDVSTWNPSDLSKAISDPTTKPELLPYLKEAQSELNEKKQENATIVTPVGLVPLESGSVPLLILKKFS